MSNIAAAASYRDDILESLKDRFLARLDKSLEEGREPETSDADLAELRTKYETWFSNYLSTAFDVVFRNELSLKSDTAGAEVRDHEELLNLSVTDDDLQNLDNAVTNVCRLRKLYPGKCAALLEKSLQIQTEAAERIRSHNVFRFL